MTRAPTGAVAVPDVCGKEGGRGLGYLEARGDAEVRMARGEQQRRCVRCGLWIWPAVAVGHEFGGPLSGERGRFVETKPGSGSMPGCRHRQILGDACAICGAELRWESR